MGLSNAEKQARWQAKRNAEAKLAQKVLQPSYSGTTRNREAYLDNTDREAAVMNLLNTEGAEWTPGFVEMLRKWKPDKIAKRRRRKIPNDLQLLNTDLPLLEARDPTPKLCLFGSSPASLKTTCRQHRFKLPRVIAS